MGPTARIRGFVCWGAGAVFLCGTWACESDAGTRQRLGSINPLDRAQAAVRVAEQGDVGAVHRLVDLLEDPSDGVRMYAILALERLTGETYGYQYYANESQRAAAVERWRAALRAGEVSVAARTSTAELGLGPRPAPGGGQP